MPRPKKVHVLRKPGKAETGLARLCDELAIEKHQPVTQAEYMVEAAGGPGIDQMRFNGLTAAADARRDVLESLSMWVEALATAKAAEMAREFHSSQLKLATARPLAAPKPSLRGVVIDVTKEPGAEFEPFLAPKQVATTFLRLLTVVQKRRWAYFFEDHGCLLCKTKKRSHVACGMCDRCYERTKAQLKAALRKHTGEEE